jgi:uncharacterized protein YwgA
MTERFDKVIAALDYLGINPNIADYNWRFIVQKVTFLAQSLGLSTDYVFTPYVKGPYARTLTDDYYSQSDKLSAHRTNYELKPSEVQSLDKINEYCDLDGSMAILESTSTYVYIINQEGLSDDDEIYVRSKALKPYLSDTDLLTGLTTAKQLLFKDEYLTVELKREIEAWEKVE